MLNNLTYPEMIIGLCTFIMLLFGLLAKSVGFIINDLRDITKSYHKLVVDTNEILGDYKK